MTYWNLFVSKLNFFSPERSPGILLGISLSITLCQFSAQLYAQSTTIKPADNSELRQLLQLAIESADSFKDRFDAEVWLVDMSDRLKKILPAKKERIELLKAVHQEATRTKLHPELVLAVIHIESHFDRFAISRAGAQGLMQVMPFWLKEIGHADDNLVDLRTNLRMGCTILKFYLDKEKGDLIKALARYNGSYGSRKYADKVLDVLRTHWFKH